MLSRQGLTEDECLLPVDVVRMFGDQVRREGAGAGIVVGEESVCRPRDRPARRRRCASGIALSRPFTPARSPISTRSPTRVAISEPPSDGLSGTAARDRRSRRMRSRIARDSDLTGSRGNRASIRDRGVPDHSPMPNPPSSRDRIPTVSALMVCNGSTSMAVLPGLRADVDASTVVGSPTSGAAVPGGARAGASCLGSGFAGMRRSGTSSVADAGWTAARTIASMPAATAPRVPATPRIGASLTGEPVIRDDCLDRG